MEEELFLEIGKGIKGSEFGNLFGKPCFKLNSKAFICFFEKSMVFKLKGRAHGEALNLTGSKLFDPSGKNRPMKEWVQVAYEHKDLWSKFASNAKMYNTLARKTMQ